MRILSEKVKRVAPHIGFSQAALKRIYDLSLTSGYCQPGKAISILDAVINRIQQFKIEDYAPSEYWKAQEIFKTIKEQGSAIDSPLKNPLSKECIEYVSKQESAQREVKELEWKMQLQKNRVKIFMNLNSHERQLQKKNDSLALTLQEGKASFDQIRQFLFDTFFVFPRLAEKIEQMSKEMNGEMPLRIDIPLVDKIFKEDLENRKAAESGTC